MAEAAAAAAPRSCRPGPRAGTLRPPGSARRLAPPPLTPATPRGPREGRGGDGTRETADEDGAAPGVSLPAAPCALTRESGPLVIPWSSPGQTSAPPERPPALPWVPKPCRRLALVGFLPAGPLDWTPRSRREGCTRPYTLRQGSAHQDLMHLASKWARLEDPLDPGPLSVEGGIWGDFLRGGLSWTLEESWKGGSRGKGGFAEAPEARRGAEVVREVRPERLTPKGLDFLLQTPERTWEGGPQGKTEA